MATVVLVGTGPSDDGDGLSPFDFLMPTAIFLSIVPSSLTVVGSGAAGPGAHRSITGSG